MIQGEGSEASLLVGFLEQQKANVGNIRLRVSIQELCGADEFVFEVDTEHEFLVEGKPGGRGGECLVSFRTIRKPSVHHLTVGWSRIMDGLQGAGCLWVSSIKESIPKVR